MLYCKKLGLNKRYSFNNHFFLFQYNTYIKRNAKYEKRKIKYTDLIDIKRNYLIYSTHYSCKVKKFSSDVNRKKNTDIQLILLHLHDFLIKRIKIKQAPNLAHTYISINFTKQC